MTCGNRSREKKIKGYTLKKGEIDKTVYVHNYKEMIKDMTPDLNADEIIVPVQTMFPNCQKYDPCCTESGTEEMMKKFDKMTEKPSHRIKIIKRVKPVKKNPFPDEAVEKW